MKGLTDIPGIRVGHVSDYEAITGCTVILAEGGAVAGVDMRGSATGSQEADVLNPLHITPHIHGICLAGGSAFGLEAASGVRDYLESKKIGFAFRRARIVPIVPSSILFDLGIGRSDVRPTREMGQAAAAGRNQRTRSPKEMWAREQDAPSVKSAACRQAMKGGVGSFTVRLTETYWSRAGGCECSWGCDRPEVGQNCCGSTQSAGFARISSTPRLRSGRAPGWRA